MLTLEKKTNLKGNTSKFEKSVYNKFRPLRVVLIITTIMSLFICKPSWCYDKGTEMVGDNCQTDVDGVTYNVLDIQYANPLYIFVLQIVTELVILIFYVIKMSHVTNRDEKEIILWSKCILFVCTAASGFLYAFGNSFPLHSILFIIFLGVHK